MQELKFKITYYQFITIILLLLYTNNYTSPNYFDTLKNLSLPYTALAAQMNYGFFLLCVLHESSNSVIWKHIVEGKLFYSSSFQGQNRAQKLSTIWSPSQFPARAVQWSKSTFLFKKKEAHPRNYFIDSSMKIYNHSLIWNDQTSCKILP